MPLTEFQSGIARLIAVNRRPESHIAGGAVLNRGPNGLRISRDLDIFHDEPPPGQSVIKIVASYADSDIGVLNKAGYSVEWVTRTEAFQMAIVSTGNEQIKLEWSSDSAFRFFPVQEDEEFGYCLHQADLATNKVLALAGRSEIRDFLDVIQLDREYLSLGALIWAACGKDPGYTPSKLLDMANRHSRYQEGDLKGENLTRQVDLR